MSDIPFSHRPKSQGGTRSRLLESARIRVRKVEISESELVVCLKQAVPAWLVSRGLYVVLTYLAALLIIGRSSPHASFPPLRLLSLWQRWDVNWYLSVSAQGYHGVIPPQAAFFPLYPSLTATMTAVIGASNRLAAAMIVTSLGALAACIGLGLLATREFGASGKDESKSTMVSACIRVMLAYPLALFMFAGYADSLLVAFCAFSLYFARTDRFRYAALCAFAAGLTRRSAACL
jgi:hypothetical protein